MSGAGGGERFYRGAVRALSLLFVAIGLVVLVTTLANGGGPAATGILIGIAFIAVGAMRLWLGMRTDR